MFIQVDLTIFHKTNASIKSWRQMVRIGLFNGFLKHVKEILPTSPTKCPADVPMHLENPSSNYTDRFEKKLLDTFRSVFRLPVPKGLFRTVVAISADDDAKVARVEFIIELK
jgi:hypothetical protein